MGWESEYVVATLVIVEGSGFQGGVFVYSGPAALGNLILSVAPFAGNDDFGNFYPAGFGGNGPNGGQFISVGATNVARTAATKFIEMLATASAQQLFFAPDNTTWIDGYIKSFSADGSLQMVAPKLIVGGGTTVSLVMTPDTGGPAGNATLALSSDLVTTVAPIIDAGQTWQTPSYNSGWAGGPFSGTRQPLQYRIDAEDNFVLVGAMHTTSATPNATAFTLPGGFFNSTKLQQDVALENSAGTFTLHEVEISTAGAVSINPNLTASSHDVYLNCRFPLGHIS